MLGRLTLLSTRKSISLLFIHICVTRSNGYYSYREISHLQYDISIVLPTIPFMMPRRQAKPVGRRTREPSVRQAAKRQKLSSGNETSSETPVTSETHTAIKSQNDIWSDKFVEELLDSAPVPREEFERYSRSWITYPKNNLSLIKVMRPRFGYCSTRVWNWWASQDLQNIATFIEGHIRGRAIDPA